jgi:hypothetical protein
MRHVAVIALSASLASCASPTPSSQTARSVDPAPSAPAAPPPAPSASPVVTAAPSGAPPDAAASPLPTGWWSATPLAGHESYTPPGIAATREAWWSATPLAGHESGLAMAFSAEELIFVNEREGVSFRPATLERAGANEWAWSLGSARCVLARDAAGPGATLRCREGQGSEAFALAPAKPADGARYDAQVVKNRPAKDICPRAEACLAVGFPILQPGYTPNLAQELGDPRIPMNCVRALAGMKTIFAEAKKPLPKACQ